MAPIQKIVIPCLVVLILLACFQERPKIELSEQEQAWLVARGGTIRVAFEKHYPPFVFADEEGRPQGISVDMLRAAERDLGITFTFTEPKDLHILLEEAKRGEVDLVTTLARTPNRAEFLDFTRGYAHIPALLVVRSEHQEPIDLDEPGDLRIAVPKGYAIEEFMARRYPQLNLVPVVNDLEGLRQTVFSEVDGFVGDTGVLSHMVKAQGITNLRTVNAVDFNYVYTFAVRKDIPHLSSILDRYLATFPETEKSAILSKWINLPLRPFWREPLFQVALAMLLVILITVFVSNITLRLIVQRKTRALQEEIGRRRQAQEKLEEAHTRLEHRVEQRTAELSEKNRLLEREVIERTRVQEELAISREIANCTVHNISNVINSLVVGVQSLEKMHQHSRANGVKRAIDLITEQGDNLGTFFSSDPRGGKLLEYLSMIGDELPKERGLLQDELLHMDHQIRLIRDIARTQQNFAVNQQDTCLVKDVLEDALKIQFPIQTGAITITRRYDAVSPIQTDRIKLAHVFLNLIKNAKEAMRDNTDAAPELTLSVTETEKHIMVAIGDNGHGINPDHLDKLGTYGFTTKKDGHGFGLRYCAETLQSIGAKLVIESEGVNRGATFKAYIPIEQEDIKEGLTTAQSMGN
ncbi:transporter substrate-binding domain-containing protein [Acanthopleuribacter pedis]|uniref:histidine kinase n=1 Tax=Acanthopleuribacter pedis TaxID=442870 RepID=A0A8J7U360_9BACT|nr:transporter substrate-binding domain-containing protein [Acanthopleuribacter pedis]MBO1319292.1 transporter substrate-binding domain-containing protein [Acanthopleuribacter pedis]